MGSYSHWRSWLVVWGFPWFHFYHHSPRWWEHLGVPFSALAGSLLDCNSLDTAICFMGCSLQSLPRSNSSTVHWGRYYHQVMLLLKELSWLPISYQTSYRYSYIRRFILCTMQNLGCLMWQHLPFGTLFCCISGSCCLYWLSAATADLFLTRFLSWDFYPSLHKHWIRNCFSC